MMSFTPEGYLLCQVLAGQQTRDEISGEQWNELIDLARTHYLLPYLYWRTKEQMFKPAYRQALLRDLAYQQLQLVVSETLTDHQIKAVWLKGSALRLAVYPEPALRAMADLDVLVHHGDRWKAVEALRVAGFELRSTTAYLHNPNQAAKQDKHHHFSLYHPKHPWAIVELHFHLIRRGDWSKHSAATEEWLMQKTLQIKLQTKDLIVPEPEAHLIYLSVHAAIQHGLRDFDLRWFLDIHLLVTSSSLDWDRVIQDAVELRWSYAVERTLTLTQELFSTPLPESVLVQLREDRLPDENVYRVQIRETSGIGWDKFWTWFCTSDFDEKQKLIVPEAAYMRLHYKIPEGRAVWPYYFRRWGIKVQQVISTVSAISGIRLHRD